MTWRSYPGMGYWPPPETLKTNIHRIIWFWKERLAFHLSVIASQFHCSMRRPDCGLRAADLVWAPVSDYLQSPKGQQPLVVSQCQWSEHRARKCLRIRAGNLTLNMNSSCSCLVMGDKQECISVRFPPLIKVLLSCRLWAVSRRSCPRPQPRLRSVWSRIRPGLALAATALGTLAITLHCARTFSFLQTWSTLLLSMVFNLNIKP